MALPGDAFLEETSDSRKFVEGRQIRMWYMGLGVSQ